MGYLFMSFLLTHFSKFKKKKLVCSFPFLSGTFSNLFVFACLSFFFDFFLFVLFSCFFLKKTFVLVLECCSLLVLFYVSLLKKTLFGLIIVFLTFLFSPSTYSLSLFFTFFFELCLLHCPSFFFLKKTVSCLLVLRGE